jgi:hypothetical protein
MSCDTTEEGQRFLEDTQPALARESTDEIAGPLRIVGPKLSFEPILMLQLDEICRKHLGIAAGGPTR